MLKMKIIIPFSFSAAIILLSACGDDGPKMPNSPDEHYSYCPDYLAKSESSRMNIAQNFAAYRVEYQSYLRKKYKNIGKKVVDPEYAISLKACLDKCDQAKYVKTHTLLYRFEKECFDPGSEFKPPRFGGLTADSICSEWSKANKSDRRSLIYDLVEGTSMVTKKNYRPYKGDIWSCVDAAMTPCPDSGFKVRSAMASCMIMQGLK